MNAQPNTADGLAICLCAAHQAMLADALKAEASKAWALVWRDTSGQFVANRPPRDKAEVPKYG